MRIQFSKNLFLCFRFFIRVCLKSPGHITRNFKSFYFHFKTLILKEAFFHYLIKNIG